jgi:DNA-binding PadR family transcriptional regulator
MSRHGASRNPWWWTVLTLLHERPMHPYEIQRLTAERAKDYLVEHKPGSLYSVIEQLRRDGLVEQHDVTQEGRLPQRTVYRITAQGRETFLGWLTDQLARPVERDFPSFAFAIEKAIHLPPKTVASLLRQRAEALSAQLSDLDQALAQGRAQAGHRIALLEVEYARTLRQAEWDWVREVAAEMEDGPMDWSSFVGPDE